MAELRPKHLEGQAGRPPRGCCCWGGQGCITSGWSLTSLRPLGHVLGGHPRVHANKCAGQPASIFLFRAAHALDRTTRECARARAALLAPGLPRGGRPCFRFLAVSCPRSWPSQHGLFCAAQVREGCRQGCRLSWRPCRAGRARWHLAFPPKYRLRPLRMWGYLQGIPSAEGPWRRGL